MNFDIIFKKLSVILEMYNTSFRYQRRNCNKHGHFKKKVNRVSGEVIYELAIEREDNDAALIYTFFHEMGHMVNNHLDNKVLTYAQREWVAHSIGMYYIDSFDLENDLKKSKLNQKFDIYEYGNMYLKDKNITEVKKEEMKRQVVDSINIFNSYLR